MSYPQALYAVFAWLRMIHATFKAKAARTLRAEEFVGWQSGWLKTFLPPQSVRSQGWLRLLRAHELFEHVQAHRLPHADLSEHRAHARPAEPVGAGSDAR